MNKQDLQNAFDQIHASEALTVEVLSMRRKKVNFRAVLVAACLCVMTLIAAVLAGAELIDPEKTRPEDVPSAQIDWNMYAVWVDKEGNVQQSEQPITFSIQCAVYGNGDDHSATKLDYVFTFPENFRYEIKIPSNGPAPANAPQMTGYPYYVSFGYVYDFQKVDYTFAYWAMSLEKEWMIFEWEYYDGSEKDPSAYLIASRDPNADPKEILAYFRGFLDTYSPSGPHKAPPGIAGYFGHAPKE